MLYVLHGGVAIGAGYAVPGLTITPGASYSMAFQVTGASPTSLSGKIWRTGDAEPGAWQVTRTDTSAALQGAGSVGVFSYVPSSANAYPVRVAFNDITVTDPTIP
jgi:hypothetical protein